MVKWEIKALDWLTNGDKCRFRFLEGAVGSILSKVKILSEGNVDFVRRKFHFLSEKNSFSFGQKNGPLRSIFSYTAVNFSIHCSVIENTLLCAHFIQ